MADYFVIDAGCNISAAATESQQRGWSQTNGRLTWSTSSTGGTQTTAPLVSEMDALSYSPIFAGMTMIAGDISSMPWMTKRVIGEDVVDARDHSTRRLLLHRSGDTEDDFTSNVMVESLLMRALFYGLAGCRIYRGGPMNRPRRLELIRNIITPVDRISSGRRFRFYEYTDDDGEYRQVRPSDMLLLQAPTMDGVHGMGVYQYARQCLGRAVAAGDFADEFFTGKGVPKGFFVHPHEMSDVAQERFIRNIERVKSGQFGLLEDDMKWVKSGIDPVDASLVQLLDMSAADAARFLKIPPSKLGMKAKDAPAKTVEQENKDYLATCLNYWITRLTREANEKLFREDEKGINVGDDHYYTWIDSQPFIAMTATLKERVEAEKAEILTGKLTITEARRKSGLNPHANGVGDEPLLPLNMTTNPANLSAAAGDQEPTTQPTVLDTEDGRGTDPPETPEPRPTDDANAFIERDLVKDVLLRMVNRMGHSVQRFAKTPGQFVQSLDTLPATHRSVMIEAVSLPVKLVAHRLRRDASTLTCATVDDLLTQAHENYLAAAECSADELPTRVDDATAILRGKITEIADTLCEV